MCGSFTFLLPFENKKTAEDHRLLREACGYHAPSISTSEYWFRLFKWGDFDTECQEQEEKLETFEKEELEAV
ncbi:hypothetical protein TNIN_185721 [Trichonephila inaurata madagascariensis]|uniref:Mos1 transposase HTH domain-containing protein n=1 Tax=Trichonephila inaurata madagascariensis TaxID=2747483 RepID=A0A8X7BUN2_9ARAC|nr:hypothetical protein TNIN_185721 [Trichonephila inaurata madagascariensis]